MNPILLIFLIISLFLVFLSFLGFYTAIRPPKITSSATPGNFGLAFETISLKTADGITLKGWFIPQKNSDKVIIALHGYPADKGNILPVLRFLHEDFNLLLFDFRYLGESEGAYTTAGAKEVKDLLSAIDFLKKRGFTKIGVWGFSMGGAVALMTSAETQDIKAIISDSSYSSVSLLAHEIYGSFSILRYPLIFLMNVWARLFLGIDINDISPADKIQNVRIPILIIHSKTDEVIPFSHALRIKEALKDNPQTEFWFQEGLIHGELKEDYQKRIREFFLQSL